MDMKNMMTGIIRKCGVVFAVLMIAAGCGPRVERQLDELCHSTFPEGEPGAAVLIMRGDNILYDKGFGLADLETKAPIDGNTSFNIASVSKQFTAVAVLQLAAEGKLRLGDEVKRYFPEYTGPVWEGITVAHLLSHSSGIPDRRGYLTREQKIAGDEDLAVAFMATLDTLHFAPGTAYEYINPTYVLLGKLVERVSGESFTEYARRHIFAPAGMDKTCYFDRDRQDLIPYMAHGYEYEDVTDMPEERTATEQTVSPAAGDGESAGAAAPRDWYEYDFGEETFFATRPDGGIYTSTHEFVKWERALRACLDGASSEGRGGDSPGTGALAQAILPAEVLTDAMSPHTCVSDSPWSDYQNRPGTWYGYGWFIEQAPGAEEPSCIYHTGDNGGFKILAARYPASQTLVLVFANRADWDRYAFKTDVEGILGL